MAKSLIDIVRDRRTNNIVGAKASYMSANNIADQNELDRRYPNFDTDLGNLWSTHRTNSSGGGGNTGGGGGGGNIPPPSPGVWGTINGLIGKAAGVTNEFIETQLSYNGISERNLKINDALFETISRNNLSMNALYQIRDIAYGQVINQLKDETELLDQINSKTSLTGELSESLRTDMVNSSIYGARFAVTLRDIGDLYVSMVNESGKLSMINRGMIEEAIPLSKAFDIPLSNLGALLSTFSAVGIGGQDAIKTLSEAGVKSTSLGLSGKKVIEGIQSNIGKLNEFGFKNGIEGLTKMVQKSIEFKVSLESVKVLADKVMNPEGALDLVANMQALGGAVGDLNDPLKLMYMATNDAGGLQDAIIGASKGLATMSEGMDKFELKGVNLRLARERATTLGISYEEFAKTAIKAAERTSAANALMSKGFNLDEKQTEFLTNLSTMEGGEMVIKLPEDIAKKLNIDTTVAIDKLTEPQKAMLLANQDMIEKMSTEDMATKQLSATNQIVNNTAALGKYFTIQAGRIIKGAAQGTFGEMGKTVNKTLTSEIKVRQGKIGRSNLEEETRENVEKFKKDPMGVISDAIGGLVDKIMGKPSLTKQDYTDAFYKALSDNHYNISKTPNPTYSGTGEQSPYLKP